MKRNMKLLEGKKHSIFYFTHFEFIDITVNHAHAYFKVEIKSMRESCPVYKYRNRPKEYDELIDLSLNRPGVERLVLDTSLR